MNFSPESFEWNSMYSQAIYISIISQLYCKNSAYYGVRQFSYPPLLQTEQAYILELLCVYLSVQKWDGGGNDLIIQRRRYDIQSTIIAKIPDMMVSDIWPIPPLCFRPSRHIFLICCAFICLFKSWMVVERTDNPEEKI